MLHHRRRCRCSRQIVGTTGRCCWQRRFDGVSLHVGLFFRQVRSIDSLSLSLDVFRSVLFCSVVSSFFSLLTCSFCTLTRSSSLLLLLVYDSLAVVLSLSLFILLSLLPVIDLVGTILPAAAAGSAFVVVVVVVDVAAD